MGNRLGPFLLEINLEASLVLAAAALLCFLFRSRASRVRYQLWVVALLGCLLLPALSLLLPSWSLGFLELPSPVPVTTPGKSLEAPVGLTSLHTGSGALPQTAALPQEEWSTSSLPGRSPRIFSGWALVGLVWAGGAALLLLWQVAGLLGTWRLARGGRPVEDLEWNRLVTRCAEALGQTAPVRLLTSREIRIPAAFSAGWPTVLLPEDADSWSAERREIVLLHEMTHLRDRHWGIRLMARVAAALHWFNPLTWVALRHLVLEQERSCDEEVLALGTPPSSYASHLLALARSFNRTITPPCAALSMARRSQMEGRLMSILDYPNRSTKSRIFPVAALALLALLLVGLASLEPWAVAEAGEPGHPDSGDLAVTLGELQELHQEMEPFHEEMEALGAQAEPMQETLRALEREMAPLRESLEGIDVDMEPFHQAMRELERELHPYQERLEALASQAEPSRERREAMERKLSPFHKLLEAVHTRMEPFHEQMEKIHREMEPLHQRLAELHGGPGKEGVHHHEHIHQHERLREEIHREMEPLHQRLGNLHREMEPLHREVEEIHREMEPIYLEMIENKTPEMRELRRRIEEIHREMEPIHRRMEEVHREMEPVHRRIEESHGEMEPFHRRMEEVHRQMEPIHREIEGVHERMEPIHQRMEKVHERLHQQLRQELRRRLSVALAQEAPSGEALSLAVDEILEASSIRIHEGTLSLRSSHPEIREILSQTLGLDPTDPNRRVSLERAAEAVTDLHVEAR